MNSNLKKYSISEIENLHIMGRTGNVTDPLPLFWNHSGIELCVTGTELWVEVEVEYSSFEPWVALEINDFLMARHMLLSGTHDVCLFRMMSPEPIKHIRWYREVQGYGDAVCRLVIKSISTDGEILPVPKKDMRIEFIGDSITSGEGTYGAHDDMDWISMYMSSSRHYANFVEKELNADVQLISQGGWGVWSAWDNNRNNVLPRIYEKVCAQTDPYMNEKFGAYGMNDFAKFNPDYIIINLGTNDNSSFDQPAFTDTATGVVWQSRRNEDGSKNAEDVAMIDKAVVDFLTMVRRHNPNSRIIWTYGMLGNELEPVLVEAVARYKSESGDEKVSYFATPNTTDETFGSHWHPGLESHKNAAYALIGYIKELQKKA